jgi:hypothetical protein
MSCQQLQLLIDNLRRDIKCCNLSGLTQEKITQRNQLENGIEELLQSVKDA